MTRHANRFATPRSWVRGFTLVELLVVVGVVSVLMSILLPALARARDMAKTTACSAMMRQMSQAMLVFAAENDDRLPGSAHQSSPSSASISWHEIVSRVAFRQDPRSTPSLVPRLFTPYQQFPRGVLVCPLAVRNPLQSNNNRIFAYNLDAAGGTSNVYGSVVANPTEMNSYFYTSASSSLDQYVLGAKASMFNTTNQFLITEFERVSDNCGPVSTSGSYLKPKMNDDVTYPYWAANNGRFAFRHNNYQIGNFSFIDGHVESLSPYNDEINTQRRFLIQFAGL